MAKKPSKSTLQTPKRAKEATKTKAATLKAVKPKAVKAKPARKTAVKTAAKPKTAVKTATKPKTAAKTTLKAKTAAKTKTTPKKTTAKQTTVKKTAAKSSAKTSARPTVSKAARVTLQSQVDSLAKRLAAADKVSRTYAKSLEADFTALASQMGRTKAGHTRLTRRVTELSKTLQKDMTAMQSEVARDLSAALANPTLDTLQSALSAADVRLSESEAAQNAAIARINHHISDIATIVEARLSDEAGIRQEAMAAMKAEIESGQAQLRAAQAALQEEHSRDAQAMQLRVSELQSESAEAIRIIGDKVVDVADEMGRRRETIAAKIRQELNESTLAASAEFEQFRRMIERRLESLESEVSGVENHIDRAIAPLSSRVEGLEYGLTVAPAAAAAVDIAPSFPSAPALVTEAAAPNPYSAAQSTQNTQAAQPLMEDAFSPAPQPSTAAITPPQAALAAAPSAPDALSPQQLSPEAIVSTSTMPVPYDPSNYLAEPNPYQAAAPQYQPAPPPAMTPAASESLPYPEPVLAEPAPYHDPAAAPTEALPPIIENELPYADPAYAETSALSSPAAQSMSDARPGPFEKLKRIGSKTRSANDSMQTPSPSAILTPRNLRVGGMVAALGLASFIGVQSLVKDKDGTVQTPSAATPQVGNPTLAATGGQVLGANPNRPTLENAGLPITENTIGQYADNRQIQLTERGASELETAALSGNTVAQLQFGLSKLESGDVEGGVTLIRAAANKEQPAALYRLAKLYETGQGVGQDAKTARELTERAARGGNRIAMHDLALYYAEGRGEVEIDILTAAKWFEKAADRGVVDSQFNLGVLFESGQGLPQDVESALVWYSIAGAQGDQMAAGRVGILRKTLSPEQLSRADTRIAAYSPARIDEEANGIFNNVPWAKSAKTAAAANPAQSASVRQTQTLLNELGYEVGAADGAIGPKTRTAIKSFERTNGLAETGVVSTELIERLEFAAGA